MAYNCWATDAESKYACEAVSGSVSGMFSVTSLLACAADPGAQEELQQDLA